MNSHPLYNATEKAQSLLKDSPNSSFGEEGFFVLHPTMKPSPVDAARYIHSIIKKTSIRCDEELAEQLHQIYYCNGMVDAMKSVQNLNPICSIPTCIM